LARKFVVGSRLVDEGTFEYASAAETAGAPLAAAIFESDGVENVLIAPDFVTVRRTDAVGWDALEGSVRDRLNAFLGSYQVAVLEDARVAGKAPENDVERRVVALLDEEIRPAIAMDGGEVAFHGIEDGIVQLRLSGACGSCPSSVTTLKMGIERLLVEEIPEVRGVAAVA